MPTLSVVRNYISNEILFEAELDSAYNSLKDFFNITRLDGTNIQNNSLTALKLKSTVPDKITIDATGAGRNLAVMDASITTAKINGSISTVKIADSAITTPLLSTSSITFSKFFVRTASTDGSALGPGSISKSSLLTYSTTSLPFGDESTVTPLPNASLSLTSVGRPVHLMMLPEGNNSNVAVKADSPSEGFSSTASFWVYVDNILVKKVPIGILENTPDDTDSGLTNHQVPASTNLGLINVSAGTHSYKVAFGGAVGQSFFGRYGIVYTNLRLVAYEI